MAKVKITQVRSLISRPKDQKDTMVSLGLGKINRTRVHDLNPGILGMIKKVSHLISVEEVTE